MINVYTNRENYQYDLHALLKSFYPEHDVRVYNERELDTQKDSGSQVIIRLLDDGMELTLDIDDRKEYVHTYKNDTECHDDRQSAFRKDYVHTYKNDTECHDDRQSGCQKEYFRTYKRDT
ncbi:MAG: hypothetical protein K2G51_07990, partial [Lachnospiraceae bacterium]|nr:hypothetical protein [Lachnospiraceae bacterium]